MSHEFFRDVSLVGGSASMFPQNLTAYYSDAKALTFAAVANRSQVLAISLPFSLLLLR